MRMARWLSPWLAGIAAVLVHAANAQPTSERYQLDRLVSPSEFHGVHGLAFDAQGVLWIPAYATNELVRYDPATRAFRRFGRLPYQASASVTERRVTVQYEEPNGTVEAVVETRVLESKSDADYIPNLSTLAEEGFDVELQSVAPGRPTTAND